MSTFLVVLFWSAIALIAYIFVGYPLVLALWSALRPRPWRREASEPSISIVIAAHNEAGSIASKIHNLLSLDYPADRLEILVGSDGSTDRTVEQLHQVSDRRLRVFVFPDRRGKPTALNTLIPKARGEIIVLADVRQTFDSQAVRALVRSFADPRVGAVTGELVMTRNPGAGEESSASYWKYEKFVRSRECLVDSTIVVTGAIYAIRKTLFQSIPPDTIVDDLLIPMRIARQGYRVVFERDARAYETAAAANRDFRRKVRTVSGAFQLFARERWLLHPLRNRLWWQTTSHKALRLLVAPLQVIAFTANVALAHASAAYELIFIAQVLFYAGAIAGWILPQYWRKPMAVTFPYVFCLLSWATVCAFVRWIMQRQTVTWEKVTNSY
ncbi:MAG TPA: glycosyltransferase family 2 protein [Thermoanaerobaculia bacterium]